MNNSRQIKEKDHVYDVYVTIPGAAPPEKRRFCYECEARDFVREEQDRLIGAAPVIYLTLKDNDRSVASWIYRDAKWTETTRPVLRRGPAPDYPKTILDYPMMQVKAT